MSEEEKKPGYTFAHQHETSTNKNKVYIEYTQVKKWVNGSKYFKDSIVRREERKLWKTK